MGPLSIALALGQLAPGIIKLVTGSDKASEVAGHVVDIAKTVTGAETGEEAVRMIQADPNKLLEFQQAFGAQQGELEKAYLADRADARSRDVELHKAGFVNRRADFMVALDVVGLIACLGVIALFRAQLPGEVVGLLTAIAANFGACLRDAHQFEFGSSRSSQTKDATIANLTK